MTSILKTDEIQSQNGGSVVKMQTLKHPSSGSNNLVLASDGNVSITNTLSAGTLGSSVVFPAGNIKKIYSKTFTGTLTATDTTKVVDTTNAITIPSVSSGDFLYVTIIGGKGYPNTGGVGSNVRASITAGGLTFRGVDFYSNPASYFFMGMSRMIAISSNASNYVVARSLEGSNTPAQGPLNVTWNSGAYDPVSITVFHIGSGEISDVSNT